MTRPAPPRRAHGRCGTARRSSMCNQPRATGIIGHSIRVSRPGRRCPHRYAGRPRRRAPGGDREVRREQLLSGAGQGEAGEGVDGDRQEQIAELQGGVQPVPVRIAPEDLAPEHVAPRGGTPGARCCHGRVRERVVVPDRQVADRDQHGVERGRRRAGWPKSLATGGAQHLGDAGMGRPGGGDATRGRKGDAIAKSGAATMISSRCWTMWSQNNSPS